MKGPALAQEPDAASIGKTVVDNSGITASREIGRNISFRCAFFGIYGIHTASAGSFSSLEQEFVCADIFFFFSRRLILEKIPIGEWFEGEV